MPLDHDPEGKVLPEFRKFAESFTLSFEAERNRVRDLLGSKYRHPSGVFREEILRKFLVSLLPESLSVDTGYVHGFNEGRTSKQIDILVWDSSRFPAIFRAGQFVVVSPEAVVAAIEVKSNMGLQDIRDGISNLRSLVELDFVFRGRLLKGGEAVAPPILKSIVCFASPTKNSSVLKTLGEECRAKDYLEGSASAPVINALKEVNPIDPSRQHSWAMERAYVDFVASVDQEQGVSFHRGWGPPEDLTGTNKYGPGFQRLPYYYEQKSEITTPLEKLAYRMLAGANRFLNVPVSSMLSAWGDFDPESAMRLGDASETIEELNSAMIAPDDF